MHTVTILCAARKSVYKSLPHVDVYDKQRDARTWPGGTPIVAHPPCRAWSAHCSHQAKPETGEKDLGLWCVEQVIKHGGILEQPAHSRLWKAANLPLPTAPNRYPLWTAEVWQAWWGHPLRKATWLLFSKIPASVVYYPFLLHPEGNDRRAEQLMSHAARSATPLAFADWLISTARHATTS